MSQPDGGIRSSAWFIIILVLVLSSTASAEIDSNNMSIEATADQLVQRMMESNESRAQGLQHYTEERRYEVEYRGFPHTSAASMNVEATYDAPSSKRFRVLSQTGSKRLIDHVLKKLLVTEKEAAKNPNQTALSPENYTFHLEGTEAIADQKFYIFRVKPRVSRKFLYRGKIWVDARDYAVAGIEAELAQNPSFWIRRTEIHHVYSKSGDFWLPKRNRSETKMRTGGTAMLTIDYGIRRPVKRAGKRRNRMCLDVESLPNIGWVVGAACSLSSTPRMPSR
jgi:hypothetical protein